jgi:hypothetical protein
MAKRTTPVTVKELGARIAKAKGIQPDEASKLLRTRIRANFDTILPHWPALKAQGKANRDGNRYPPMPPALAEKLATAVVKGTPVKDALARTPKAKKPKAEAPAPTPSTD